MESFISFKAKKIGIFGLGITGLAAYRALREKVASIIVWDDDAIRESNFASKFDSKLIVELSDPRWRELDKIILSPGVPGTHEIIELAHANCIEITSDIDMLFEQCNGAKFIGITGTNGKSTTTSLIYHIMKNLQVNFAMGGNIGIPALDLSFDCEGYVLELSSFQLDLVKNFKADIAVLLNITPDHLDRHHTMQEYIKSKEKIVSNFQNGGYVVVGFDNEITKNIFEKLATNPRVIPISATQIIPGGISVIDSKIYDNTNDSLQAFELPENRSLRGSHNSENIAASIAVCRILKVEYEKIIENIRSFQGLPHRAQYLGTYNNINFYNDSKATNAEAALKSLSLLDNVYWLLGGIAKEGGIDDLVPLFSKVRKAYIFGQDKELFAETLKDKVEFEFCQDLGIAFAMAYKDASKNATISQNNILLAPAAASYDQFKNFEHRGEVFIELFNGLSRH